MKKWEENGKRNPREAGSAHAILRRSVRLCVNAFPMISIQNQVWFEVLAVQKLQHIDCVS